MKFWLKVVFARVPKGSHFSSRWYIVQHLGWRSTRKRMVCKRLHPCQFMITKKVRAFKKKYDDDDYYWYYILHHCYYYFDHDDDFDDDIVHLLRTKDSLRRSYLNEKHFRQFLTIPAFPALPCICVKDFPVLQLGWLRSWWRHSARLRSSLEWILMKTWFVLQCAGWFRTKVVLGSQLSFMEDTWR